MIDAIAFIIKSALIGGLGGLVLPTAWMSLVFGLRPFLRQFTDGSSILEITTSLIVIPLSTLFTGLTEGGLINTTLFGMASGTAVALLVLVLRHFISRFIIAIIAGVMATLVAVLLAFTQAGEIALATGLTGLGLWPLLVMYVAAVVWLGWRLQIATAA